MSKKEKITEIVLSYLRHIEEYACVTVDNVFLRWWMTGRISKGMRLTDEGKNCSESSLSHTRLYFWLQVPFLSNVNA